MTPRSLSRRLFFLTLFGGAALAVARARKSSEDDDSTIVVAASRILLELDSDDWGAAKQLIPTWVRTSATSVAAYYAKFPLPEVRLRVSPYDGEGVGHGMTFGDHGGHIHISVGNRTTAPEFHSDWMLTHEMVHLSFPSINGDHHWIEEGIATYVEPIARVMSGNMDAQEMWFQLLRDLPQGLPAPGDDGLDRTHSWANTYWGGALYCFLADVEIRRATNASLGLQDALRGILNAGGDIRQSWDLSQALKIGDESTHNSVLASLYAKMKDTPVQVDLPKMWKDLGVARSGDSVVFDDSAPLAAVRRAITLPPHSS